MKLQFPTIAGATPIDASGLKLNIKTLDDLYVAEAKNIAKAVLKYLAKKPSKRSAPFDLAWMIRLHKEMYSDVWEWAGKFRTTQFNIGVSAYQINEELAKLIGDLQFWKDSGMDIVEQAVRLHHRAVWIHPFPNGNGRWARMLGDIWLKQNGKKIPIWPAEMSKDNNIRDAYIKAVKKGDDGDFTQLLKLHIEYSQKS